MSNKTICPVCGDDNHHSAHFCKRCNKLIRSIGVRKRAGAIIDMKSREKALKQAWEGKGFRCYYTGIRLEENEPKSPKYLTFSYRTPRKSKDVVVAAWLINETGYDRGRI